MKCINRGALLALFIAGSAGAAAGQSPRISTLDPSIIKMNPIVIYGNDWQHYPLPAKRSKIEGRAVIECTVRPTHSVTDCVVLGEAPLNQGFGKAGLRRVEFFRVRPSPERGGETAGRKVRFPIYWKLAEIRRSRSERFNEPDDPSAIQEPPAPGRE